MADLLRKEYLDRKEVKTEVRRPAKEAIVVTQNR